MQCKLICRNIYLVGKEETLKRHFTLFSENQIPWKMGNLISPLIRSWSASKVSQTCRGSRGGFLLAVRIVFLCSGSFLLTCDFGPHLILLPFWNILSATLWKIQNFAIYYYHHCQTQGWTRSLIKESIFPMWQNRRVYNYNVDLYKACNTMNTWLSSHWQMEIAIDFE